MARFCGLFCAHILPEGPEMKIRAHLYIGARCVLCQLQKQRQKVQDGPCDTHAPHVIPRSAQTIRRSASHGQAHPEIKKQKGSRSATGFSPGAEPPNPDEKHQRKTRQKTGLPRSCRHRPGNASRPRLTPFLLHQGDVTPVRLVDVPHPHLDTSERLRGPQRRDWSLGEGFL